MRTYLPLIVMGVFCGCAGANTGAAPAPAQQTVHVSTPSSGVGTLTITGNSPEATHMVAYSPEAVWRALPGVFDSIGVTVAAVDPDRRSMGNEAFKVRGRLKNTPLSRYIDCGNSTQIGPNADNYDVALTLIADVRPGDQGSAKVTTTFRAVAKPTNFSQGYAECNSKGVLEDRFLEILKSRLAH